MIQLLRSQGQITRTDMEQPNRSAAAYPIRRLLPLSLTLDRDPPGERGLRENQPSWKLARSEAPRGRRCHELNSSRSVRARASDWQHAERGIQALLCGASKFSVTNAPAMEFLHCPFLHLLAMDLSRAIPRVLIRMSVEHRNACPYRVEARSASSCNRGRA